MQPGSKVDRVGGTHAGALAVRVRARAIDGAANDAVVLAVSSAFGVTRASVVVLRGHRSRRKFIEVEGEPSHLAETLAALLASAAPP